MRCKLACDKVLECLPLIFLARRKRELSLDMCNVAKVNVPVPVAPMTLRIGINSRDYFIRREVHIRNHYIRTGILAGRCRVTSQNVWTQVGHHAIMVNVPVPIPPGTLFVHIRSRPFRTPGIIRTQTLALYQKWYLAWPLSLLLAKYEV